MPIIKEVTLYSKKNNLLNPKDILVIGVSGGPDSVALLHILCHLQYALALSLHVAHFNHNLRKGSNKDAIFVQKLAKKLNLPFYTKKWKKEKKITGSIEEAARNERLKFLIDIAEKVKANAIVLAHNKNDLAETILMRILRGCGLQGLQGILPKKKLYNATFIRPLLNTTRQKIERFLKKNNFAFRTDPTNKQPDFFRNKIRLKLLPLLKKEYSPNIQELLIHLGKNIVIDYAYLDDETNRYFKKTARISSSKKEIQLNIPGLKKMPEAMRRMVIRKAISYVQGDTNRLELRHFDEIQDLIDNRPFKSIVHLQKDIKIKKRPAWLIFSQGKRSS